MIILDLDGVLADFGTAAARVNDLPTGNITQWDWYRKYGITDQEFWGKIHALGEAFYREWVHPYPWAHELLNRVRDADDYVIMTAPSDDPHGFSGKKIWIDKHLEVDHQQIIVGSQKHLLAGPGRLLIDDSPRNVRDFRAAGGTAFMFPQPWNTSAIGYRIVMATKRLEQWRDYCV